MSTSPASASIITGDQYVTEDGSLNFGLAVKSNSGASVETTIVISGLPRTGWTILGNGGIYDAAAGTWTYKLPAGTANFNGGPILMPPMDSDADISGVTVTVTNRDTTTGLTSTSSTNLDVLVDAVGDNPNLYVTTATAHEGTPASLNIVTSLTDRDGSEKITGIFVHNVPASFTLNHGTNMGGGTWALTQAQLAGLTVSAPTGFTGTVSLRIESVTEETNPSGSDFDDTNNIGQSFYDIAMNWTAAADVPTVQIGGAGGSGLTVLEDGTALVPVKATLADADGSEFLTVKVSGVPAGWTFNNAGWTNLGGGAWQKVFAPGVSFDGTLSLKPPANSDVDLTGFTVTATATETATGGTATASGTATVVVDAVADAPTVTANDATGREDTAVAVNITAAVTDTDGSESITGYKISGVPAGFTFNQGTNLGGGTWSFTPAQLAGLKISAPADYNGTINLTATATSTETPSDGESNTANNSATTSDAFSITWTPTADAPTLTINGGHGNATVLEDGTVNVPITGTLSGGTEILTATITGIPSTWAFNSGVGSYNAATGTWTVTLPAGTNLNTSLNFSPPANSDVDLTGLNVTLSAYEPSTGTTATTTQTFGVTVDAVADVPTINAVDVSGREDTAVAVNIAAGLRDTDGSEAITGYKISGVPAGFSFNQGTNLGGGTWSFTPAQLAGLKISAPANYNGTINLTATVLSAETPTDMETSTANNNSQNSDAFSVTWSPVAETPTLTVNGGHGNATVLEDGTVSFTIMGESNGSATEVLKVTVTGIPAAWGFNAPIGTYNAVTGVWTATLPAGTDLNTVVTFSPPANSDVDLNSLNVTLTATEPSTGTTATSSQAFGIIVDAVADVPTINAVDVSGREDTAVAVNIAAGLRDTDGSEHVTGYKISGVPAGFTFNQGTNLGGGVWSFTPAQLAGLKISSPADYNGTVNLTATVLSAETASDTETNTANNNSQNSDTFNVTWAPTADAPTLTVNGGHGNATVLEDGTVNVALTGQLNGAATEYLKVTVTGIPAAWGFSAPIGTYNAVSGVWTATLPAGTNLNTALTFSPPANSDVDLNSLNVTLTATEPSTGTVASSSQAFGITVDAVADVPTINAVDVSGREDTAVAVNIAAGLRDTDGSEHVTGYKISGVPAGFSFNQGANLGGGVWSFTPAQLAGLKISSPVDYNGTINLTATVLSAETPTDMETSTANNTSQNSDTFNVTWAAIAETPTLTVNGGHGNATVLEDGTVNVALVGHSNGSATEVLKVTVTGIPAAWGFSAPIGTYNAATGTWTATLPANTDLNTALTFSPPANSDVDLSGLNIALTATEPSTGTTATTSQAFGIIVDAVADAPTLTAANVSGEEGHVIALNIATAVRDTDGSESIKLVRITDLPAGATLTAGTQVTPGVWEVTKAQLTGLGMSVPTGSAGTFTVKVESIAVESTTHGAEPNTGNNEASTNTTFTLTVAHDDVPVLVGGAEQITIDESNIPVAANDSIAVNFGSDGPGTFAANGVYNMGGLKSGGLPIAVTLAGNTYTGKAGTETIFTLQINANGTYTYKQFAAVDHLNPLNANDSVSMQLGFKATDSDGDVLNSTITVNILDDGPFAPDYIAPVDENSLSAGPIVVTRSLPSLNFGFDGPGSIVPTGTFQTVVAADGSLTTLKSDGHVVTVTATANGYVGKVGTDTIFTLEVNPLTGAHTYKQFAALDHPDPTAANESLWLKFQVKATDGDGDSRTFFIGVDVHDDAPVAANDVNNFDTSTSMTTTGNVLTGAHGTADHLSSDGNLITRVTIGGTAYNVATTGTTNITGANGVLHINANGSYTYTKTGTGDDVFTYTVKDGDGDSSTATLTMHGAPSLDLTGLTINGGDNSIWVKEDHSVTVPFNVKYAGGDGDETVTIKVTGVPNSWTFSGAGWVNLGGGIFKLVESQRDYNGSFTIKPPANSDADLTGLTISADLYDPDTCTTKSSSHGFSVRTDAVADAANLVTPVSLAASWDRDNFNKITFAFPIVATQVADLDGSQVISKVVIKMNNDFNLWGSSPDDAHWYLNKGTEVSPGVWEIPVNSNSAAVALAGLQMIAPKDAAWWSGLAYHRWETANITVEVHTKEINLSGQENDFSDNTAVTIKTVPVSIYITPLVLDLGEKGIDFVSQDHGVMFDMNNNGTLDKTTWVGPHDGLLAIDMNGDGVINNQSELFGDNEDAANGFAHLGQHDVNRDGVINASDSVFENLLVWQDANQDGISQAGELHSLTDFGITGIRLGATETGYNAADGWISHESTFLYANGTEGQIVDAWFNIREGSTLGHGATLNGTDERDTIIGTADNDVITGGKGDDILYGDAGADTFVFTQADGSVDTVKDFHVAEGDKLDLSQILDTAGFDPVQDSINNFVYAHDDGVQTVISVDVTGSGNAANGVAVAVLTNVTGASIEEILAKTTGG